MARNFQKSSVSADAPYSRRAFLGTASGAALAVGAVQTGSAAEHTAISFPHSFLHCIPNKSGIQVRIQIECYAEHIDVATGQQDAYVLGTVAKTGVTPIPDTDQHAPGYDYSLVVSKTHVFTKRSHASAQFNNPTTTTVEDFGKVWWDLRRVPAEVLESAPAIADALRSGRLMTARSEFTLADTSKRWRITYPVKWVDCAADGTGFRVETGPVILPHPDRMEPEGPTQVTHFRWAHLDYNDFAQVRCLIEVPTALLDDVAYAPGRERVGIPAESLPTLQEHVDHLERAQSDATAELFHTDHYSRAEQYTAVHQIMALGDATPATSPRGTG